MFHQIRMWCCLSYMIANILSLLADIGLCDGRHTNIAMSMSLMFFYQASLWWNMCETHATFKGITAGLINGRTSIYHPFAWGMPLICIGFITFFQGDLLGTHPTCFISWEKTPIMLYFAYNGLCFVITLIYTLIIIFNMMKVQSHNKDTVMYLKDQIKGMFAASLLMFVLWCYGTIGYFSYMKTNDMDVVNLMPLFQIFNGWFGVLLFLVLGMWSKRFRQGLSSQAEEKRRQLENLKHRGSSIAEESPSTAQTSPTSSQPASPFGSRPSSPVESRPVTAARSRPATAVESRPGSSAGSRPASSGGSGPDTAATSRPATAAGSRPATAAGSRPATASCSRPGTAIQSRPVSAINEEPQEDDLTEVAE